MEEKKFMDKYGFLFLVAGIIIVFVALKLMGFPEFLYK